MEETGRQEPWRAHLRTRLDALRAQGLALVPYLPRAADRLVAAVAVGRAEGRALVVLGEEGSGKTALFAHLAEKVLAGRAVRLVMPEAAGGASLVEGIGAAMDCAAAGRGTLLDALGDRPLAIVLDGFDAATEGIVGQVRAILDEVSARPWLRLLVGMRTESWLRLCGAGEASPFGHDELFVRSLEAGLSRPFYELRGLSLDRELPELHGHFCALGSPAPAWPAIPGEVRTHLTRPARLRRFHELAAAFPGEGPSRWLGRMLDERLDAPGPAGEASCVRRRLRELPRGAASLARSIREVEGLPKGMPARRTLAAALLERAAEFDHDELVALAEADAQSFAAELLERRLQSLPAGSDLGALVQACEAREGRVPALLHAAAESEPWLAATGRTQLALELAELRLHVDPTARGRSDASRCVGQRRAQLDRWREAARPLEESVELARGLGAGLDLVRSLHALARYRSTEERPEEACWLLEESLAWLRAQAEDDPALLHERACALEALIREGSLASPVRRGLAAERVELRRRLLRVRPCDPTRTAELAWALRAIDVEGDTRRERSALVEGLVAPPLPRPERGSSDLELEPSALLPFRLSPRRGWLMRSAWSRLHRAIEAEPERTDLQLWWLRVEGRGLPELEGDLQTLGRRPRMLAELLAKEPARFALFEEAQRSHPNRWRVSSRLQREPERPAVRAHWAAIVRRELERAEKPLASTDGWPATSTGRCLAWIEAQRARHEAAPWDLQARLHWLEAIAAWVEGRAGRSQRAPLLGEAERGLRELDWERASSGAGRQAWARVVARLHRGGLPLEGLQISRALADLEELEEEEAPERVPERGCGPMGPFLPVFGVDR